MLGIGSTEFVIILVFGFLVFGPDKLPQMGRTVGRMIRQFREASDDVNKKFKEEIYDPFQEVVQPVATEIKETVAPIQEAVAPIKDEMEAAQASIKSLTEPIQEITQPIKETREMLTDPLGLKNGEGKIELNPLKAAFAADKAAAAEVAETVGDTVAAVSEVVPLSAAEGKSVTIADSLYGLSDPFADGGDK